MNKILKDKKLYFFKKNKEAFNKDSTLKNKLKKSKNCLYKIKMNKKIVFVSTHPIQYQVPIFKKLYKLNKSFIVLF